MLGTARLAIDHVYNFFVTAYRIQDYVAKPTSVPNSQFDAFLDDQGIRVCEDLCDKGKHRRRANAPILKRSSMTTALAASLIGSFMVGGADEWVLLAVEGREIEVVDLTERVIEKWEPRSKVPGRLDGTRTSTGPGWSAGDVRGTGRLRDRVRIGSPVRSDGRIRAVHRRRERLST
jgi:hypothetical protein